MSNPATQPQQQQITVVWTAKYDAPERFVDTANEILQMLAQAAGVSDVNVDAFAQEQSELVADAVKNIAEFQRAGQ